MNEINRRTASLLALLSPLAAAAAQSAPPEPPMAGMDGELRHVHWMGDEQVGMLMYPGMTTMDLMGPQSMFAGLMGGKVFLVAKTMEPVTTDGGVTILPTATFETCPRDLTILFAPGGSEGTLAAATDPATLAFMANRGARAKYVTSVCTGSLILGAAGLLKGYKATSHWSVRHVLGRFGAIPTDARVVHDRSRITGAGVTAGLDLGLAMLGMLRGRTYAECNQLLNEYDPQPPFNAGSPKKAPPKVRRAMVEMMADFAKKAAALPMA